MERSVGIRERVDMKKNRRIGFIWCIVLLIAITSLGGCSNKKEKTTVTLLYSTEFKQFKQLVEDTYSDIELVYERTPYLSEQIRKLAKGVGPDIVISSQPDFENMQEYLLDLSDTQASSQYDSTITSKLMVDGKNYLLPLPGTYYSYIINETMFKEAGIPLPTSLKELESALSTLKSKGLGVGEDGINFSIESNYNASLGLFFVGMMVPDFLGTVEGVKWLADLERKESKFTGTFEKAFTLSNALISDGVLDPNAIALKRNSILIPERMALGNLAAVFGSSNLMTQIVEENKTNVEAGRAKAYEYRMLPLLSDEGNHPWVMYSPIGYVGINASSSDEKKEASKKVIELLSTEEGQKAIMSDLKSEHSYLKNDENNKENMPAGISEYIEEGYVYNVQFPNSIIEYLGLQARKTFDKSSSIAQVLEAVDDYHVNGSKDVDYDLSIVGFIDNDLLLENYNVRKEETKIGNLIADSIKLVTQADIAVINGGAIRSSLYQGDIYGEDLKVVCPFDDKIVVLKIDGDVIWRMLENSLSTCTDEFPGGRFLQVSGISYTFDSSKPIGSRLQSVVLENGTAIQRNQSYTLAVNDYMAGKQGYAEGNGDGYMMLNYYDDATEKGNVSLVDETNMTYQDAMKYYFEHHMDQKIHVELENRIVDIAS